MVEGAGVGEAVDVVEVLDDMDVLDVDLNVIVDVLEVLVVGLDALVLIAVVGLGTLRIWFG